jgi:hypothetical protein
VAGDHREEGGREAVYQGVRAVFSSLPLRVLSFANAAPRSSARSPPSASSAPVTSSRSSAGEPSTRRSRRPSSSMSPLSIYIFAWPLTRWFCSAKLYDPCFPLMRPSSYWCCVRSSSG